MLSYEIAWVEGQFSKLHERFDEAIGFRPRDASPDAHPLWEDIMSGLTDLIANSLKLKDERAALLVDRDAEKARADKLEADLAALKAQVASDESKAADAAKVIGDEADAEAPQSPAAPTPVTVTTDIPAGVTSLPITSTTAPVVGSTVTGDAIQAGTTVADGTTSSTLVLDTPTVADHAAGDVVAVTPAS